MNTIEQPEVESIIVPSENDPIVLYRIVSYRSVNYCTESGGTTAKHDCETKPGCCRDIRNSRPH